MRRFDLLDEYAIVILPMRHRDVPRHASEERQPDDICMDMAIFWPPLLGMLGLLGLMPGRSFLSRDRGARLDPEAEGFGRPG